MSWFEIQIHLTNLQVEAEGERKYNDPRLMQGDKKIYIY